MVMPGDNIKIVVELIAPIAMEQGLRFAIREGGKTVGRRCSRQGFSVNICGPFGTGAGFGPVNRCAKRMGIWRKAPR